MCGIVALWDATLDADARLALARAMALRIAHRGPDGDGAWAPADGRPLVLAHRRLAIRGLGAQGAQPMVGEAGVLSFNGELFGTEPLYRDLVGRGARFEGTSDTEILLRALDAWGFHDTLSRIKGQFAFTWWSNRDGKLYLARDRVGIRPAYFARVGQRFAAASEQKSLLLLRWVDARPSPVAMMRYLIMSRTDDVPRETLVRGIESLPAGHWASWDGDRLQLERYHRFETTVEVTTIDDVRAELKRAVAEQLVSDVPIGATVSGGLDSSTIALLADRERLTRADSTTLHLFAYHDDAAEQDEREYQDAVIAAMRSPHEVHWVSSNPGELVRVFDAYIDSQEEPYGDVSSYAESCLAAAARASGVKVLLNGLGGDEVFVGYPPYFGPLLLDVLKSGDFEAVRQLLSVAPEVTGGASGYGRPLLAAAYHALPASLRNVATAWRVSGGQGWHFGARRRMAVDAFSSWHPHDGVGHTNAALRGSIESWSVPRFLLHSDRMGLAHSVESRVPLLDDGVIRAGFGVAPAQRVGRSGIKAALRAALADILPPVVRDRRWKLGFHAPLGVYVAALDDRLREGHDAVAAELGRIPAWEQLDVAARWRFGNLGAYLLWGRRQR